MQTAVSRRCYHSAGPNRGKWGSFPTAPRVTLGLVVILTSAARAQPACVQFDVSDSIACTDVTSGEFAVLNPDEKLVELRFHISSLIHFGYEHDLFQYLFVVVSPQQRLRIVDYSPKTEMSSEVVGNVKVEQGHQKSSGLDINSSGGLEHQLGATISAQAGQGSTAKVQYEVRPPLELLAASGTTQRGAGAYFKLKPSSRMSLEGTKEFGLVLRVPREWRGDYLQIHCAAYGEPSGRPYAGPAKHVCGASGFVVPLYLEGDLQAKEAANRYVQRERQLRQVAVTYAAQIRKHRYPTWGHRVAALVDLADPKIPDNWLERIIGNVQGDNDPPFRKYLPDEVNTAIDHFLAARQELRALAQES